MIYSFLIYGCATKKVDLKRAGHASIQCSKIKKIFGTIDLYVNQLDSMSWYDGEKIIPKLRNKDIDSFAFMTKYEKKLAKEKLSNLHKYYYSFCRSKYYYLTINNNKQSFYNFILDSEYSNNVISSYKKDTLDESIDEILKLVKTNQKEIYDSYYGKLVNADLNSVLMLEKPVIYPDQKGQTIFQAKQARKDFFQETFLDFLVDIYYLSVNNKKLKEILDKKFPGPFSEREFSPIKVNINKLLESYLIESVSSRHKFYKVIEDLQTDHFSYLPGASRGGIPDKSVYINSLVSKRSFRENLLGLLLISELNIDVERIDKKTLNFKLAIDFPNLLRKYRFSEISDYIE